MFFFQLFHNENKIAENLNLFKMVGVAGKGTTFQQLFQDFRFYQ